MSQLFGHCIGKIIVFIFLSTVFAASLSSLVAHVNNYVVRDPGKVFAELVMYREISDGTQEQVYLRFCISLNIWAFDLFLERFLIFYMIF